MKLDFKWKNDGNYHQYCMSCHAEKVHKISENDKTYYLCKVCRKINERSIVIDPTVNWWIDKNGDYWHESAGVFVLNKANQLLLFERTIFPFLYTVPSGHVDKGENPLRSAQRELEEEVGIKTITENLVKIAVEDIVGDSCRRGSDAHRWHAYLYVVNTIIKVTVKEEGVIANWFGIEEALAKELTVPVGYILNKYKKIISGK